MNTNQYAKTYEQEAYALLKTLAAIPAPSNHEEKRAAFCLEWLQNQGVSQESGGGRHGAYGRGV